MNYVDVKADFNRPVKKADKGKRGIASYIPVLLFGVIVVVLAVNATKIKSVLAKMLDSVNIVSSVTGSQGGKLKEIDGRTNILLLGSDQRSFGDQMYSELTDSIMIVSIGKATKDVVIISIPRDLWVQSSNGGRQKINELYGIYGGKDGTGTMELLTVVEDVLGIPVHYYGVVNFSLFKETIDLLGGVEVNVENSFTDKTYPIEGKESAPEDQRYETVVFTGGAMKMDGEMALKYARSRHGDSGEGTDFARAKRQQNLMMAIKQKALSSQTLLDFSKIKGLFDLYSKNVDTNLDLSSLQLFYTLAQSAGQNGTRTLVLDDRSAGEDGGLLYAPTDTTLYGGKYVLIPKSGDYSQIHAYIQKYLFD